jgi:hypothetical protein
MRKMIFSFLILILMFGGGGATAYASECYQDTLINKTGDWLATFGRSGRNKKNILEKRKYERVSACTRERRALRHRKPLEPPAFKKSNAG